VAAKRLNAQPTGHANMGAKVMVGSHFTMSSRSSSPTGMQPADAKDVIFIDQLQALHAESKPHRVLSCRSMVG